MTKEFENKVRQDAKVEKCSEKEYIATWASYSGHSDTPNGALDNLIIGMEWEEYFEDFMGWPD